jgi:hypothetical protein
MESDSERLSRRLIEEGEKTGEFFRSLPPVFLDVELYTDGGQWKVGQIMAHFLGTEIGIFALISSILDGNPGTPEDFDLNRYNERKIIEYRDLPVPVLIDRFLEQRRKNALAVNGFNETQLNTRGRHPYLGFTQIHEIIKLLYRHNQIHQRDIRRLLLESQVS